MKVNDRCPSCRKQHKWRDDVDAYDGLPSVTATAGNVQDPGRTATLWLCDCGATVGVMVDDGHGATLYVPHKE